MLENQGRKQCRYYPTWYSFINKTEYSKIIGSAHRFSCSLLKNGNNISFFKVFDYFDKYTFLCEMYDEDADEIKELVLNFFPFDNSVQVIDTKKGKNLLRRVQLPPLKVEMLQIGNIVNIFSKLLHIKDCAPITRRTLFNNVQRYIIIFLEFLQNGTVLPSLRHLKSTGHTQRRFYILNRYKSQGYYRQSKKARLLTVFRLKRERKRRVSSLSLFLRHCERDRAQAILFLFPTDGRFHFTGSRMSPLLYT